MNEDGIIELSGERVTLTYERRLRHALEDVWRAITTPDEIQAWSGWPVELELRPGGRYVTTHQTGDTVTDRVVRVEPPRLFEHTFWEHVNPSALVTWELNPDGDDCCLTLTHALDLADVRNAAATMAAGADLVTMLSRSGAGWHHLLDALETALGGASSDWDVDDQQALVARYAARVPAGARA